MGDPLNSHNDLDDLLESALDDFGKLELDSTQRAATTENSSGLIEERQEKHSVQGLGVGLPSPPSKRRGKQKIGTSSKPMSTDAHVAETLEKLAQQTRQTLQGLDSAAQEDPAGEKLVENLFKQFEEIGGTQDMQSVVDTMMRQLLSKEILHEPMKEIGERYPIWLEERKSTISKEDYERYSCQYELIKQLCKVYEAEPDNFDKIVELMQKMQDCGQPPSDIVQELAPGLNLGSEGGPALSELFADNSGSNCSIM